MSREPRRDFTAGEKMRREEKGGEERITRRQTASGILHGREQESGNERE